MLYAFGALHTFGDFYDIETVAVTIYQPRRANVDTWEISVAELQHWAETEVKPKAELAAGEGRFCPGSWCQFCKIAATCRARAKANLALARLEFAPPAELSDVEIADVLAKIPDLKSWASDVEAYALSKAVNQSVVLRVSSSSLGVRCANTSPKQTWLRRPKLLVIRTFMIASSSRSRQWSVSWASRLSMRSSVTS